MDRPPSAYRMWLNSGGRNIIQSEFPEKSFPELAKEAQLKWNAMDWKSKKHWEDMHNTEYAKFRSKQCNQPQNGGKEESKSSISGIKIKKRKTQKKNPNPGIKLKMDENLIKKKIECAAKEKKVSRLVSKEALDQSNKRALLKPYNYNGNDSLVTFGGIHNKYGAKMSNTITIPTDVLPVAGTTKQIISKKCQGKSLVDISHMLKIHPDKSFGYNKLKMNAGARILSSIDKTLVDDKGLPNIVYKGAKPKKNCTPLMFATETEQHCVGSSVLSRISHIANSNQKKKLGTTLSKVTKRHPYQEMDHGIDRAVMQAMTDYCYQNRGIDLKTVEVSLDGSVGEAKSDETEDSSVDDVNVDKGAGAAVDSSQK